MQHFRRRKCHSGPPGHLPCNLPGCAFVDEQAQHAQTPEVSAFVVQTMRDTLENWQSEFLQLMWQISGLAILYHVG